MKKSILLILVLLLLLTACQGAPVSTEDPTVSTPPTSAAPTAPTTQPTTPTTQPSPKKSGHVLIFQYPIHDIDWWPTEGLVDHLYWVADDTKECILLCDEPVYEYAFNDSHIFFVKNSEPSKVYAISYNDLQSHELIYESDYGNITYMLIESDLQGFLQFVAEEKKFVVLDLATGKSTLLMEQDYIIYAWLFGTGDGVTWSEIIEFAGIAAGNIYSATGFTYNYVTGELGSADG